MKSNEAYALLAIALINGLPHCLFETPIGIPPMTGISAASQTLGLVILLLLSRRIIPVLESRWLIVAIPLLLCAGVAVLNLPYVPSCLAQISAGIVGICEAMLWLYQGAILSRMDEKTIPVVALGGMEASFFLASAILSLSNELSIVFQTLQALLLIPLLLKQVPTLSDTVDRRSTSAGRKPLLPFHIVLIGCAFSIGMNFLRTGVGSSGNWGSTFALAALLSSIILYVELSAMRGSLISILEISVSLLLAGPILYLGAGFGHSPLLLSLATIGFFLIMPRLLQWIIVYAREEGISPFRSLCVFYLINAVAQMLGSKLYKITELISNTQIQFGIALLMAAAIVLCCFIPYNKRARDRIILQFEDEETDDPDDLEAEPDMAKTLKDICARIAEDHLLTKRESEVLGLLARRKTLVFISEELVLSRNTVKSHVLHIHQKLNVHSHEELFNLIEHYDTQRDSYADK